MIDFTSLLYDHGVTAGLVGALAVAVIYLVRVLADEDRSSIWRGRMYHAIYSVSGKRDAEKKYISNDINGRINLARKQLHFGKSAIPSSVAVEWVDFEHEGSYDLGEDAFVVRLDASAGQERNIAKLATTIVGRTSLVGIRHLVETPLQLAVELNLVRDLLSQLRQPRVLDWFMREEYQPSVQKKDVAAWNQKIVEIDDRGLFTRVLLVEYDDFGKRIAGMIPRPYMAGEIEHLVDFLFRIATKQLGEDVPLRFIGAHMKIGVILVARTSKLLTQGIEPYVRAMNVNLADRVNAVYVIVFDKEMLRERDDEAHQEFVRLTAELDKEILNSSAVQKDFSFKYTCRDNQGNSRKAMCTRYVISPIT